MCSCPAWSSSLVVGVGWGASSWVDPVEARRLRPGDDHTEVTLAQIRALLANLVAAGRQPAGAPPPLVMLDAGNDPTALAQGQAGRRAQPLPDPAGIPPTPHEARHAREVGDIQPARPRPAQEIEEPAEGPPPPPADRKTAKTDTGHSG
jgi:hypothetical protein